MGKQRGLTFPEVLLVLAIIGIITALAVPSYKYFLNEGELRTIQAKLLELQNEQEAYRLKHNHYPEIPSFQVVENGYTYHIETENVSADSFKLIATREEGNNDCQTMAIDHHFYKTPEQCWR